MDIKSSAKEEGEKGMVGGVSPPFGVSGSLLDQGDQRVDRPAALALESDDDGVDLQLVDLGVLQGDGDDMVTILRMQSFMASTSASGRPLAPDISL